MSTVNLHNEDWVSGKDEILQANEEKKQKQR